MEVGIANAPAPIRWYVIVVFVHIYSHSALGDNSSRRSSKRLNCSRRKRCPRRVDDDFHIAPTRLRTRVDPLALAQCLELRIVETKIVNQVRAYDAGASLRQQQVLLRLSGHPGVNDNHRNAKFIGGEKLPSAVLLDEHRALSGRFLWLRTFSQGTADDRQEFGIVYGFFEKSRRSCTDGTLSVHLTRAAGDHNDRDHGESREGFQPLHHDEAVASRQTKVEDNQVRPVLSSL
jgi:hypothetical protein